MSGEAEGVCIIPLGDEHRAVVDPDDYDLVKGHKWSLLRWRGKVFAQALTRVNGRRTTIKMHRLIAGAGKGQVIVPDDGDGLNCRRQNLVFAKRGRYPRHHAST